MSARWLAGVVCVSLAGCASVKVPLTAAEPQAPDARLLGTWRMLPMDEEASEEDVELYRVSRMPGGNLVLEDGAPDGPSPAGEAIELITAEIDGSRYASLGALNPDEGGRSYLLVRYELLGADRLQLYLASVERLEDAIRRRWIAGKRQGDRHFEVVALKANARQLRKFIAAHGREVYGEAGPLFERVSAEVRDYSASSVMLRKSTPSERSLR